MKGWDHRPVAQNKIHAGSDVPLYLHRCGSWPVEDSHLNKEKKSEEKKNSGHKVNCSGGTEKSCPGLCTTGNELLPSLACAPALLRSGTRVQGDAAHPELTLS